MHVAQTQALIDLIARHSVVQDFMVNYALIAQGIYYLPWAIGALALSVLFHAIARK